MSSESELREAMRSAADIPLTGIDPEALVRTVRARRFPKQIAFSSLTVLAIAGVATLGAVTLPALNPAQNSASTAAKMASAPETSSGDSAGDGLGAGSQKFFDAQQWEGNLCGTPTLISPLSDADAAATMPASARLVLSLNFPATATTTTSEAAGVDVTGTVTLTNTGTTRVSGTTAPMPIITVSRAGITVWHTHGPTIMQVTPVELDPGQSQTYDATFTPVECAPQDEPDQFRDSLPALAHGTYEISAHIVFISDSAEPGDTIQVSGPASSIELR